MTDSINNRVLSEAQEKAVEFCWLLQKEIPAKVAGSKNHKRFFLYQLWKTAVIETMKPLKGKYNCKELGVLFNISPSTAHSFMSKIVWECPTEFYAWKPNNRGDIVPIRL